MVRPLFVTESSGELFKKVVDDHYIDNNWRRRKKKKQTIRQKLIDSTKEYTQNTTLHGLRYVGADDLHVVERLFWTGTFIFGILAAAYFINILYGRWNDSPMIISLSPVATSVNAIPFPSITLCSMNGALKNVAEDILNDENDDPRAHYAKFMLKEACKERLNFSIPFPDLADVNSTQMEEFVVRVSQPCHKMIVYCKWRGRTYYCPELFAPDLTDDGMCCTFNQIEKRSIFRNLKHVYTNYTYPQPAIDWTPEGGYPEDASEHTYPFRAVGTGESMGLSLVLDAALNDYYCSTTASAGFKMILHNPIETPKISDFAYYLSPGFETRVEIRPKISTSTPSVYGIPQAKRLCYFTKERNLRFFKTYTQSNCELECQSNFTYHHCHCIPFYLPKDDTTRICGIKDIECVATVRDYFNHRIEDNSTDKHVENCIEHCSCFPGCVQVQYNKHTSTSQLQNILGATSNFLDGQNMSYFKDNMAVVHFFFMENSFTPFEKGEIFGFTDFLSNIGGLLGLFLGFSFMSAAEILYFMSLRIFCNRKKVEKDRNETKRIRWPFLL